MVSVLNGLTAASISLWVKSTSTGIDNGLIYGAVPSGDDEGLSMRYDSVGFSGGGINVIKVAFGDFNDPSGVLNSQLESSSNAQTTRWHHIVATWESNQVPKLYLNGVENIQFDRSSV